MIEIIFRLWLDRFYGWLIKMIDFIFGLKK